MYTIIHIEKRQPTTDGDSIPPGLGEGKTTAGSSRRSTSSRLTNSGSISLSCMTTPFAIKKQSAFWPRNNAPANRPVRDMSELPSIRIMSQADLLAPRPVKCPNVRNIQSRIWNLKCRGAPTGGGGSERDSKTDSNRDSNRGSIVDSNRGSNRYSDGDSNRYSSVDSNRGSTGYSDRYSTVDSNRDSNRESNGGFDGYSRRYSNRDSKRDSDLDSIRDSNRYSIRYSVLESIIACFQPASRPPKPAPAPALLACPPPS